MPLLLAGLKCVLQQHDEWLALDSFLKRPYLNPVALREIFTP